jgi:hypothetical protein
MLRVACSIERAHEDVRAPQRRPSGWLGGLPVDLLAEGLLAGHEPT